jgi:hypothetical protein
MAKKTNNRSKNELDSVYVLKLVMYLIIASQWLKIATHSGVQIPIPVGAVVAILFAMHDHFSIDRKVEYAIILVAMFIGFWVPLGLQLTWN